MEHKLIAAGHICLDITPVFDPGRAVGSVEQILEPGKLIHMNGASVHTGGSVANTGLALKLLGNDVTLLGKVGDDAFGAMVRRILKSYGCQGLLVDKNSATSYSVVLAIPGIDRIFLHDPGANDTFTGEEIPERVLEQADHFHFGYPPIMAQMYRRGGELLAAMLCRVKQAGLSTSLDLAAVDPASEAGRADWEAILARALPWVDFFVPSFEELAFMLDRPLYDELAARGGDMTRHLRQQDVARLSARCLALGCGAVLLKCGTWGMYYKTAGRERLKQVGRKLGLDGALWADREGYQPCFEADCVRSGTGAGDVSIAAYLTALCRGKDPAACAALAAAEGACSVTSYDALGGIRPLEELEARIESGWKTMGGCDAG